MRSSGTRTMLWLTPVVILVGMMPYASAQIPTYDATTEVYDSTWNSSTRVRQTRVEANGQRVETQVLEAPSMNGGYSLVTATDKETMQDGPGVVRIVERRYVSNADGRRQLSRIVEVVTTVHDGHQTTVRITHVTDLDGHLHAMEREVEESVVLNASTRQTVTTRFLLRAGEFAPVQQTVTIETGKDNGTADVQHTVSYYDGNGKFIPAVVTHTVEEQSNKGDHKRKEELVLQADAGMAAGEGRMSSTLRTVTQEWKVSNTDEHSLAETHSMFRAGVAPDRQLHMYRQVTTSREVMPNGDTQAVQDTADINPGVRTDVPQPRAKVIEITHSGADGRFETRTISEAPSSSGAMQPFSVSTTQGFRSGSHY